MKRALVLFAMSSCATLGTPGEGDVDLPTAGVGPFRKLVSSEVREIAPAVLRSLSTRYREPSALAVDPAATTPSVYLYVVVEKTDPQMNVTSVIARTRADDARSFYGTNDDGGHTPRVVLAPDAAWEGARLAGPSALRVGAQIWIYYAAGGAIGLARSDDGVTFRKEPAPILAHDPSVAWEGAALSGPSVAQLPDGGYRMLYASGASIGEAESTDGVTWRRRDADPTTPAIDAVLGPSDPVDPAALPAGAKPPFDTASVGDPFLFPRITPAGRLHVRVVYAGVDATGQSAIGFAARYGDSGPLSRQASPLYSVGLHEAAPTVFQWSGGVMLYVHEDYTATDKTDVIAAGVAPATLSLGVPGAYASEP